MKPIRFALGSILFLALHASSTLGQAQRTFVSGLGNDGNACTRSAPCRTLAQAISQTNAGGEAVVLDSAGYGPATITKSISLIAPPGVYAGISVFSGDGIDINAGASDTIILRGLTVNNQGSAGNGIVLNTGGTLHVESCVVNGFSKPFSGIGIVSLAPGKLEIKDSIIRGNDSGIILFPSSGTAMAAIDHVRLEANKQSALFAGAGSRVTVSNSIASGNGSGFGVQSDTALSAQLSLERCVASNNVGDGIIAESNSTGPVQADVESCVFSNNGSGISTVSNSTGVATVRVSGSTVTNNGVGLSNSGSPALLLSRGNNTVEGNVIELSGTIGSYTAK